MQTAFLCVGQREQLKKLDDPSEQQCGEHRADTDAVKRAVLEQAQSSADGNHREVKPVLNGGKPQMKHLGYRVHDAIGRGKHHAALDAEEHARAGDEHRQRKAEQPQWQRKR